MLDFLKEYSLYTLIIRIVLASVCGGLVGLERTKRSKAAGIRTHIIIAATAAVIMCVSKYGFTDLATSDGGYIAGIRGADPARIAAQVVSGISFLGAGVIFKHGVNVRGLTTAAGIWATAGVGLAIGAGMYVEGLLLTAVVVVCQLLFHWRSIGGDAFSENEVIIRAIADEDFKKRFSAFVEKEKMPVNSMQLTRREDGKAELTINLKPRKNFDYNEMNRMFADFPEIISVSMNG